MAFSQAGPSSAHRSPRQQQQHFNWPPTSTPSNPQPRARQMPPPTPAAPSAGPQPVVDPTEWFPHMQRCRQYFLDHAQHDVNIQAVASFINIRLPCQQHPHPVLFSSGASLRASAYDRPANDFGSAEELAAQSISLLPYVRRLVVTGFDDAAIMENFFGPDWVKGVGPFWEIERRNYLFAAKSVNWLKIKASYEPNAEETIPYLMPMRRVTENEIQAAEYKWSEWLAFQDWMVGPRIPPDEMMTSNGSGNDFQIEGQAMRSLGQRIKIEED